MDKYVKMKSETVSRMVVEPSRFRQNLLQLKSGSILTDIVITCNDKSIPAHKCILSASSLFFKLLFMGTTKSPYKQLDSFDMSDILDDVKVVESIIDFTYTGTINMDSDNFANVVGLSYFLAMHDLTEICTRYLSQSLNKDNCLELYLSLYKSELVTKERESAPYINRETDVMQTVWDMVESKFYDHIIIQDYILQINTEDMLHLLSKGIVKNFSVERVLEFTTRWLKADGSDDSHVIAEMFLNLAHERIQLSSQHEHTEMDKDKVSILARNLDDVLLVSDMSEELKSNISTKLTEIQVIMETGPNNLAFSDDMEGCETKQEMSAEEYKEMEAEGDVDNETVGGKVDEKESKEADDGNGADKGDKKEEENDDEKINGKDVEEIEKEADESKGEMDGHVEKDIKENGEVPKNEVRAKEDSVDTQKMEIELDPTRAPTFTVVKEPIDAQALDTAAISTAVTEPANTQVGEAVTVATVEEAKGAYDSDTDDLELLDFEPVVKSGGHRHAGGTSDSDTADEGFGNKKKMSPLEKVKMLNFEKSVKDRVARCLKTQTQKYVNKILKNSKLTTIKRTSIKPRRRIVTIDERKRQKKVKDEIEDDDDDDDEDAEAKQEEDLKKESEDEILMSNLYVNQEEDDHDYDETQDPDFSDSDCSEDIHPVRVGRSARKKRKVSVAPKRKSPAKKEKKESQINCAICDKTFTRNSKLKIHMNIHRGIKPYRCVVCGMLFGRGYHVLRHMSRKHVDVKTFECDVCQETFEQAKDIVAHSRGHVKVEEDIKNDKKDEVFADISTDNDGKKMYCCKICKKSFSRSFHLRRHLTIHTGEKGFTCSFEDCKKGFTSSGDLKMHVNAVHLGISAPTSGHKCDYCKRVYQNKENFDKHAEKCNGLKNYQCEKCSASFYRQYHLDRHRLVHSEERPFSCTECSSSFKREHKLKEHMKKHSGETVNRQVICELCGAVLKDIKYLRRHLDSHDGTKRHQCHVCKKTYTQAIGLKIHMRIHTGLKPYQCEICSMLFSVKSNLMRHQRRHRGDRKHKCDQCGKGFVMAGDLRRHYTMHTGEKNFPCRFCGKKFSSKSKVPQHERIHTGEKPYECQICGKRFIQNGDRKRHEMTHGGKTAEKPKRQLSLYEIANGIQDEDEMIPGGQGDVMESSASHTEVVDRMAQMMEKQQQQQQQEMAAQNAGIDMSMNDGRRQLHATNVAAVANEYEGPAVYSAQNPNSSLFLAAFATGTFNY